MPSTPRQLKFKLRHYRLIGTEPRAGLRHWASFVRFGSRYSRRQCMLAGGAVMDRRRRRFLQGAAGVVALPLVSRMAAAQAYPTRPVHLIVGFAPAGPADILGRLLGQWLSERLGQQFVVENRPGAGTNIATEAVI